MEQIVSTQNPQIKGVCALHNRKGRVEQGRFLIEGRHLLAEAIKWRMDIETVYYVADGSAERSVNGDVCGSGDGSGAVGESSLLSQATEGGSRLVQVSEQVMRKLSTTETPQGVAAVLRFPEVPRTMAVRDEKDIVLVLDRVQDPGNLGSILRVALATDVKGILLTPGCADPFGSKALRGGMGSQFGLRVLAEVDGSECRAFCEWAGAYVAALAPGGRPFGQWARSAGDGATAGNNAAIERKNTGKGRPLVLILGNEGSGIAPELLGWADDRWSLPMSNGVESLNVAVTAGIVLYGIRGGDNGRS
ncbi:MAG: RNA methyltransferase [Peptococcaceae bacterium]|nr:RNA methyltransferase [Peptococcaceae bacterium]